MQKNLHSTLVLLKDLGLVLIQVYILYLHSTLVLLKAYIKSIANMYTFIFTFYFSSIKSIVVNITT